jgi:hypothetical protein
MSDAYWRAQRRGKPSKPPARGWRQPDCPTCGAVTQRLVGKGPLYEPGVALIPHICNLETPTMSDAVANFLGIGEPQRDGYGRPLITPPDGGKPIPYTRVSTFAEALNDAGGLVTWKGRMTARGIAQREDLAAMVAGLTFSTDPDEAKRKKADKAANKLLDGYIETAICAVDDKAAWGTAIHSFTEPDPSPFVPERMRADVESYEQALRDHDLTCVEAERFVVHDGLQVAGTFDGIWEHPVLGRVMGDKKTGKVKAQAVTLQLACYTGGLLYSDDPVERTPLDVRQDIGLLFHIPKGAGKTEVFIVDLEAGRAAAKAALWVRQWRERDDLLTFLNPLTALEYQVAS